MRAEVNNTGRFHPLTEEVLMVAPPLIPPPPLSSVYPRFSSKNPYVHQPGTGSIGGGGGSSGGSPVIPPPVPRHGSTPPRSNGRPPVPVQLQQQAVVNVQQSPQLQQNLSPIRSCSETESGGSPLGGGLSTHRTGQMIQLQKSPSAPPLKQRNHQQHHHRQQQAAGPAVPRFEFPAPPPRGTSGFHHLPGRPSNMRHRSDESLSGLGIGSSLRGEAYSTRIHSSADDVSSAARSERSESDGGHDDETEDSSSDESYTKTEAEADPDSPRGTTTTSPHFRLPSLLPMSLDIEKAWSRMNAEFTADGHRPDPVTVASAVTAVSPKLTVAAAPGAEAIELKGV